MAVEKADLLFYHKDAVRSLPLESRVVDLFHSAKDKLQLPKMAIARVLANCTTLPQSCFSGQHFANDLYLSAIVKDFLMPTYTGPFLYEVMKAAPTDIETIQFRQAIVKEIQASSKKEQLEGVYHCLGKILNAYSLLMSAVGELGDMTHPWYYPPRGGEAKEFAGKVSLLYHYLKAVEQMSDLAFNSGLSRLRDYARRINGSTNFRDMSQYVKGVAENLTLSATVEMSFNLLGGITSRKSEPIHEQKNEPEPWLKGSLRRYGPHFTYYLISMLDKFIEANTPDILTLASTLGDIEFYLGALTFSEMLAKRGMPSILPEYKKGDVLKINDLHNPLLCLQELSDSHASVPNNVYFDDTHSMYIITGPNDGGKSIFLRAVALAVHLGQNGYPIPASEAEMIIFDDIYTHMIPKDDIKKRRGRYRQELQQLRYIFENATPDSLLIFDEPCGGTDAGQGVIQSLVTSRKANMLGAKTLFATHMHEIPEEIERNSITYPYAHNLQVEIRQEGGRPILTYKVLPGKAGQSYGELVAKDVGVDEESLDRLLNDRFPHLRS